MTCSKQKKKLENTIFRLRPFFPTKRMKMMRMQTEPETWTTYRMKTVL